MLATIRHRGPDIFGVAEISPAVCGQNYLPADLNGSYENQPVPVVATQPSLKMVVYVGQIGNCSRLCRQFDIPSSPFQEEHLLLELYTRYDTDMFSHLGEAVFAFAIIDENKSILAARDLSGEKTLFYVKKDNVIYLGSETLSLLTISDEVYEFPAGHYMDQDGEFTSFRGSLQSTE